MAFHSPFTNVEVPNITIDEFITSKMKRFVDRVALIEGITDKQWTYGEVLDAVDNSASGLVRMGVRQHDVMALCVHGCPEYYIMSLACWRVGAVIMCMNPTYTPYEITRQMTDSGAKWIFTENKNVSKIKKALKISGQLKGIITLLPDASYTSMETLLLDDGSCCAEMMPVNVEDEVALLMYSSGTTGLPKGVMITHHNIIANILQRSHPDFAPPGMDPSAQRCVINYLPFFHAYGLIRLGMMCLCSGTKIVILPRFETHLFLDSIQKYKADTLYLVPATLTMMLKHPMIHSYDLSSIKMVGSGSAPLKPDVIDKFMHKFSCSRVSNGYGMTELTCSTTGPLWNNTWKKESVGVLLPNMEAKIVDTESGALLGVNAPGELLIKGPSVMKGYKNNPEETRKTIDKDGFLRTGDIAFVDSDGYLFIVDRKKELIKYKGFQVAPAEVESVLLTHDSVTQACVVGLPDDTAGELPAAAVVITDGAKISQQELLTYTAERLASYKTLRGGIFFVNDIPKTATGKLMRRKLKEYILTQLKSAKL